MLARNARGRRAPIEADLARSGDEARDRSIFRRSRFPAWELDLSRAMGVLEALRVDGVTDVRAHSRQTPEFLQRMKQIIPFTNMNDAMFVHMGRDPEVDRMPANLAAIGADDAQLLELLQILLDGGSRYESRCHTTAPDGRLKEVIFGLSIEYQGEYAVSVIGTLVELSERVGKQQVSAAAQADLARASRAAAVGAVSASIAHELNQPLGAVVMNGQTCLRYLRRDSPDIDSAISAAERVVHEGHRASEIVRQTRDLIAKRRTCPERTDMVALIKEAVGLLDREIATSGAQLTLHLPGQPIWLFGDRVSLQQTIINLLGNALTALSQQSRAERWVTITLVSEDEQIHITVQDTGPGVAPQDLERIFDPFFTTKEGGMGMGLAISRSAIEAHGGTLTVHNAESGGAVFEAKVPRHTEGTT